MGGHQQQQQPPPPPEMNNINPASAPSSSSTSWIIAPQYCLPHPVELVIARKALALHFGNFSVTDHSDGRLLFKVKDPITGFHDRRILLDAAGNPILTLQQKVWSAHSRWQAFRGESKDNADLLFSVKRSSIMQFKTQLNVYIGSNTSEEVCDFNIKGSWFERSCVIYAGGPSANTIVAQMRKKHSAGSIFLGKDRFMVTVYPHTDCAFIAALIVILDAINREGEN